MVKTRLKSYSEGIAYNYWATKHRKRLFSGGRNPACVISICGAFCFIQSAKRDITLFNGHGTLSSKIVMKGVLPCASNYNQLCNDLLPEDIWLLPIA